MSSESIEEEELQVSPCLFCSNKGKTLDQIRAILRSISPEDRNELGVCFGHRRELVDCGFFRNFPGQGLK